MDINARLKKSLERQNAEAHAAAEDLEKRHANRLRTENEQKADQDKHNAQFDFFERILRQQLPENILPEFCITFGRKKNTSGKILSMSMSLEPSSTAMNDMALYATCLAADDPQGTIYIEISTIEAKVSPTGSIFMGKLVDNDNDIARYELNELNPNELVLKQLFQDFMNRRYPE